jgi:hypothetical protein
MKYELYIGGQKIEEITPEIKRELTQKFVKAFGGVETNCTGRRENNESICSNKG